MVTSSERAAEQSISVVDSSFQFRHTEFVRHPITTSYRIGLFAVIGGLLLLPLIYFGIIAAVAYGIYFHVTHDLDPLQHLHSFGAVVLYIAPVVIGLTLIWFMLRMFFVRADPVSNPIELVAEDQPVLFDFIHRLCAILSAPKPQHVFVDLRPNASASLRPGLSGFRRREVDLTIGLPLVAHLDVAEFGGVLAHEFGHFAQGAAMRLTYLIRLINNWLVRTAFQPEILEQKVSSIFRRGGLWGALIALGARTALWLARRILHGMVLAGHVISCFSLRQMEYDADSYEAKISGPSRFAAVMGKLPALNDGFDRAMSVLDKSSRQNRLAQNFVELLSARSRVWAHGQHWSWHDSAPGPTSWFSTHPADSERVSRVRDIQTMPVIDDSRPASALFSDFAKLSEVATLHFYQSIGLTVEKAELLDVENLCTGQVLTPTQLDAVHRYLGGRDSAERALDLEAAEATPAEANGIELQEQWHRALEKTELAFEAFLRARRKRVQLLQALAFREARVRFKPKEYGLIKGRRSEIEEQINSVTAGLNSAEIGLLEFEKSAGRLLLEALRKKRGTETPPAGVSAALDAIRNLKPAWKKLATLSEGTICLSQLLNAKPTRWNRRRLAVQLAERAADLREKVNEILVLTATPNPLAEGETVSENLKGRFSTEGSTKETQALWERGNAWAISPGSIISFSRVSALMRRSIRTLRRSES